MRGFLVVAVFLLAWPWGAKAAAAGEASAKVAKGASPAAEFQLDNGLRVVLLPEPWLRQVAVAVAYGTGAGDDPQGYKGLAHLAEHLTFRGTRHLPDGQTFELLERMGAHFNGYTELEHTIYFAAVASSQLETLLWLEAERMAFAADGITDENVRLEKAIVTNERWERSSGLGQLGGETLRALYGPGHALRPSDEPDDDLAAITADGLRRFLQGAYRPDNATLAIVGRFDPAAARATVERLYGSIRAASVPRWGDAVAPPPRDCSVHHLLIDHRYATGRPMTFHWWLPGTPSAEQDVLLDALSRALEERVRRGLASTGARATFGAVGPLVMRSHALLELAVNLDDDAAADGVETLVLGAMKALDAQPIAEAELRIIKASLIIDLARTFESPLGQAMVAARWQRPADVAHLRAAIDALRAEDVQATARRVSRGPLILRARKVAASTKSVVVVSEQGGCP